MRRAEPAEQRRLNDLFAELCAIPSAFGSERACADRVAAELRDLGLEVSEDAAAAAGAQCGNLVARVPAAGGPEAPSVLLCAHLDTVAHDGAVEPVLDDGAWVSAGDTILGADNKAAVAVILAAARLAVAEPPPCGLELLFTVSEENALAGAKQVDVDALRSTWGYVFDHASPIGEVVTASPTYHRVTAHFHGVAAHAGIRPEAGRNAIVAAARAVAAMHLGRIDEETTTNVGTIAGGSGSTNVVAEHCTLAAEARSLSPEKVEAQVAALVAAIEDGASATECDVDVEVERLFEGYRVRGADPALEAAEAALRARGFEPRRIATGGGSDANALEVSGLHCVNLANGTERNHQPDERVTVAALNAMLDVVLGLPEEVAARC